MSARVHREKSDKKGYANLVARIIVKYRQFDGWELELSNLVNKY